MKTNTLIKSLKKIGLDACLKDGSKTRYECKGTAYNISWHDQDGEADCVYIIKNNEKDCLHTDYFPGFFAKKLSDVTHYLAI